MFEFNADSPVRLADERPTKRRCAEGRAELADRPRGVGAQEPIRMPQVTDHHGLERWGSIVSCRHERIATYDARPTRREVEMPVAVEQFCVCRSQDLDDAGTRHRGGHLDRPIAGRARRQAIIAAIETVPYGAAQIDGNDPRPLQVIGETAAGIEHAAIEDRSGWTGRDACRARAT